MDDKSDQGQPLVTVICLFEHIYCITFCDSVLIGGPDSLTFITTQNGLKLIAILLP